jgi:hypothetical protein
VAAADQARVREQVEAQLVAEAQQALLAQIQPGEFLPPETVTARRVLAESYDHAIGEPADVLGLTLRLSVDGLAIFEDDARVAGVAALDREVPAGYRQIEDALTFSRSRDTVLRDGRAEFVLRVTGRAEAVVDPGEVRSLIAGETASDAARTLQDRYDLADEPAIVVEPAVLYDLWPRLPWVAQRIFVIVEPR